MAKTLLSLTNEGLKVIGEPEVTSFTSTNILQERLIEAVNDGVEDLAALMDFDWTLKHTTFTTTAKITTEYVSLTGASTTVTSVDSDGNAATGFGSISAGMKFRRTGDTVSYTVSSVATGSSPHTLVLTDAYTGTFSTSVGYTAFQDEYAITDADFDSVRHLIYESSQSHTLPMLGQAHDHRIAYVGLGEILNRSGGDLHANTSGVPAFAARIANNASEQPRLLLWPYPAEKKLMNLWYSTLYSTISATSSVPFASDAPQMAYNALGMRIKAEACLWDKQELEAQYWLGQWREAKNALIRRENRETRSTGMGLATYRRRSGMRYPVRSGYYFDHKSAQR